MGDPMLGGVTKGSDFRGAVSYVFNGRGKHSQGRGIALGGTVGGLEPESIAEAFEAIRSLRPDIAKPVIHLWASAGADSYLSPAAWLWIGQRLAEQFQTDAWIAAAHDDTRNAHCHYILSRVRWNGTVAREVLRDYRLVEDVMAEAERRFNLRPDPKPERAPGVHGRSRQRKRFSEGERKMAREGKVPQKTRLLEAIAACEAAGHRGYRLLLAMQASGWTSDVKWRNGRPVGLVWHHESGVVIPSRRLGDDFKVGAFLRRIGGIPGMHGSRPLPQRWTPPPYRARSLDMGLRRSPTKTGVAAGCSWWDRALTWAWRAVRLVAVAPIQVPEPTMATPQRPAAPPLGSKSEQPIFAPKRR